jgi:ABC-2 type transport system permease protein
VSILQVYAFLAIAALMGITFPTFGYVAILPALVLTGLMLGAIGMFLSSTVRQLENFAGVMNFVIFPAFFLSSALYPLWRMRESSQVLYQICLVNPFTHAVELIRFALYVEINWMAAAIVAGAFLVALLAAIWGYNPSRGFQLRTAATAG